VKFLLLLSLLIVLFTSCNSNGGGTGSIQPTEDKFLGVCQYFATNDNKRADHSMDGLMATVGILGGTRETYSMQFLNHDMVFSIKDDSTLVGVDNTMTLQYQGSTQHLILHINQRSFDEFSKLK
jgi:hypothetical protein